MKKLSILCASMMLMSGCATELNSFQRQELNNYKYSDMAIEEKSTTTAAFLGILPGGGSFYTRNYGLGVVNLLFWPISILWDPISGVNGAETINYTATKYHVKRLKDKEITDLDRALEDKEITEKEYKFKMRKIEDKFEF